MKLGQQALEALQAEITGRIYPGDDLVVAGETGISGTLELICREWDKLRILIFQLLFGCCFARFAFFFSKSLHSYGSRDRFCFPWFWP